MKSSYICALLVICLAQNCWSQGCKNIATIDNIYMVAGQPFAYNLTSLFSGNLLTFVTNTSVFQVTNYGTLSNNTNIFHQNITSVINVIAQTLGGNPNVLTGQYGFLTSVNDTEVGYQIYSATMNQTTLEFTGSQIDSTPITAPFMNCSSLNYFEQTSYVVSCLFDASFGNGTSLYPVMYTSPVSGGINVPPIYTQSTDPVSFSSNDLLSVQTQLVSQSSNKFQSYLATAYYLTDSVQLYIYTIEFNGPNQQLEQPLAIIQVFAQNYTDLVDFYLSTDATLFTLSATTGLTASNLNSSQSAVLAAIAPFGILPNTYQAFSVYEIETSTTEESFFVAITNGTSIQQYSISGFTDQSGKMMSQTLSLSTNALYTAGQQITNAYLNSQYAVFSTESSYVAQAGPLFFGSNASLYGAQTVSSNSVTTFDPQNNILTIVSLSGAYSVQLSNAYISQGASALPSYPSSENFPPSSTVTITATSPVDNSTCPLTLNFYLLQQYVIEALPTVAQTSTPVNVQYPAVGIKPLSPAFNGPNLQFVASAASSQGTVIVGIQQWGKILFSQTPSPSSSSSASSSPIIPPIPSPSPSTSDSTTTASTSASTSTSASASSSGNQPQAIFAKSFQVPQSYIQYTNSFIQASQTQDFTLSISTCQVGYTGVCTQKSTLALLYPIQAMDFSLSGSSLVYLAIQAVGNTEFINLYTSPTTLAAWTTVTQFNITTYVTTPIPAVSSFKFVENNLYVISANPPSLQAVSIVGQDLVYLGQLQGFSQTYGAFNPQQIFANTEAYGSYAFIDNQVNLLVTKALDISNFAIITSIPYSQLNPGQQVGVGLTQDGIFIAFSQQGYRGAVNFYPRQNVNTISFDLGAQQKMAVQTLATTYSLNYPMQSGFTNSHFYVYGSSPANLVLTQQLLVYQNAPSAYNSLYTVQAIGSLTSFSTVSIKSSDLISVFSSSGVAFYQLYPQASLIAALPNLNGQLQGAVDVSVTPLSNGVSAANFTQSFTFNNTLIYIVPNVDGVNMTATSNGVILSIYPPTYFTGPVIQIESNSTSGTTTTTNNVNNTNQGSIATSPQAFCLNAQGQIQAQTYTGIYMQGGSSSKTVYTFDTSKVYTTCPFVFLDSTGWLVSICNTASNAYAIYNNTNTQEIPSMTSVSGGAYFNGFVLLYNAKTVNSYVVNYTTTPNCQLLTTLSIPAGFSNFSPLNISAGMFVGSTQNPSIGFTLQNEMGEVNLNQIVFNVPFAPSSTSSSASASTSSESNFDITTITVSHTSSQNINWVSAQTTYNIAPTALVQLLQVDMPVVGDQIQVPVLLVTKAGNLRVNVTFDQTTNAYVSTQLVCQYTGYGSQTPVYGASASNDMIVVPYTPTLGNNVTYAVYQSANPLFGGNQQQVCQDVSSIVNFIGGYQYDLTAPTPASIATQATVSSGSGDSDVPATATASPLLQVLSNGQIAGQNQNDLSTLILQLSPAAQVFVSFDSDASSQQNVTIIASNYFSTNVLQFNFTGDLSHNSEYERPGWSWLWFGLILAGLVIILGTVGFLCSRSQQRRSDPNQQLIEV